MYLVLIWFARYYILVFVFFSQGESVELFLTQLKMCIHMYMWYNVSLFYR